MYIINPHRFGVATIYDDATSVWSFRKVFNWSKAVIKIKRVSDSASAFVFFDGAAASDLITLNSFISTSSDTSPDTSPTVTLSTFIGSNDAVLLGWYGMTPDNTINTDFIFNSLGGASFITAGVIITDNSLPAADFDGSGDDMIANNGSGVPELATGNEYTIFCVSANDTSAGIGAVVCTSNSSGNRLVIFNDRRASPKRVSLIATGSGTFAADLLAQQNSSAARLLTVTVDTGLKMTSYFDGTSQTNVTYAGTYTNDTFRVGAQQGGATQLNGRVQEIVIFPTDKTSDLTALHNDINSYYSIF